MPELLVEYLDPLVEYYRSFDYATDGAAGIDLAIAGFDGSESETWLLLTGESLTIDCGVAIAIPEGYYGRVVMRSGLGFKKDLACHIGTIDSDYRGPVKVRVRNHGRDVVPLRRYERFAQLIIQPYARCDIVAVDNIERAAPSERGMAGFGSTGI